MQFERIPNARLQRLSTDVNTHKLTATISVYPAKFTKTGSERRYFSIERTRARVSNARLQIGDPICLANVAKD